MTTIYKYIIGDSDYSMTKIPKVHRFLSVQIQNDKICAWVEVDTDSPLEERIFRIFGTGHRIPNAPLEHIGTIQKDSYVWHIYVNVMTDKGAINNDS